MSTSQPAPTDPTPACIDDDLQALADEIAATTGVAPATAMQWAVAQYPGLRQYVRHWDVAAQRARAAMQAAPAADTPGEASHE